MTKGRAVSLKSAEEPWAERETTDALDVHIGRQLRIRRRALGIRSKKLSLDAGISNRQLQRYEAGSNRAIATRLYDFARLLDAAPGYFFEGYGDPSEKTAGSGSPHDQATLAMVHSSHEVQTLLIAYLKVESRRLREDILRMILDLEGM